MLDHYTVGSAKAWSSDPQHAKTGRPITTEFCEMYKHRLPEGDTGILESIIGEQLRAYDYPLNGPQHVDA